MVEYIPNVMPYADSHHLDMDARIERLMTAIREFRLEAILDIIIISEYPWVENVWDFDRRCLTDDQWEGIIAKLEPILQSAFRQRQIHDRGSKTLN